MNITEFCIRRPALTIVLSLVISILGILGYHNLRLRWVPNVEPPIVSVFASYPGASSSLVESQVTTPIESALAGVDGVETTSSSSKQGESHVMLTFKLGHNMNVAVEDVRSALLAATLPTDVKTPYVGKSNADATPILYLAFSDNKRSEQVLSDYVQQFVIPRFETIEGVASVMMYGERTSAMQIALDPKKMAALNVSTDDVNRAVVEQNIELPSGQLRSPDRLYNVIMQATLHNGEEFNNLIIRDQHDQIVRLKDISTVTVGAESSDSSFRVNGQKAVALGIIPQSTANPLLVTDAVLAIFKEVQKSLPEGMKAIIAYEQGDFIRSSVKSVRDALIEAIALVTLVIFLFLASWRATLIPVITIPICLISTLAILATFNFSINTITLMALVLAIGLVVDDAIVMLENISRYIEQGISPVRAAIRGSKEIVFPIIAMTLTLAAVYFPIAFTGGILGSVFREFAVTLAGIVIISGAVALTLSPMMCAKMLQSPQKSSYYCWLQERFSLLQNRYQDFLLFVFGKKKWLLLILMLVSLCGIGFYHFLPKELAPHEDMNEIDVYLTAPKDASFQYTDRYVRQLEAIFNKIPEMKSYFAEVASWAPGSSYQEINLVPANQRKRSTEEIADWLTGEVKSLAGVTVNVSTPSSPLTSYSSSNGSNIVMKVQSTMDFKNLHEIMQHLLSQAQKYPGFDHVDTQLKWDGDQFEVNINREKAADMHISIQSIATTLSTLLAGKKAGRFEYGGKQYDIMMQMDKVFLMNPNIISELYVRNDNNQLVPLSGLVSIHETTTPETLPHFDRLRADTFFAGLTSGYTLGDAIKALQKIAEEVLPENAKISFVGEARNYLDSSDKMNMTYLLAIVFIYLVLVAQFESFIDPLIILLTVPFALIGALMTLKLTGNSLNIYSQIGLVTLIGLIAKHGILITEFANLERELGASLQMAAIKAASLRLRPILMTTAAMVLGAIPLACATGPGSETRHQIGWVIVGGMLLGTFFSLVVIPTAYTFFAKFKKPVLHQSFILEVADVERTL